MTQYSSVAEMLADPNRWTQGAFARDAAGGIVAVDSPDAVCWCLTGALVIIGG